MKMLVLAKFVLFKTALSALIMVYCAIFVIMGSTIIQWSKNVLIILNVKI